MYNSMFALSFFPKQKRKHNTLMLMNTEELIIYFYEPPCLNSHYNCIIATHGCMYCINTCVYPGWISRKRTH